jgi:glycosyltransferase involved in cell wall biosynthesis
MTGTLGEGCIEEGGRTVGVGPLISAVIPSYNYGRFVCDAAQSALAQTYAPIEVIVVDDGSTDDTRERLEPYSDRIRYIYQENGGLSAARNTGIREARGEWIALLDADDLWHPQKLAVQLQAARAVPGSGLIGAMPAEMFPQILPAEPVVKRLTVRDLLLSVPFGPSSALIRKKAFEKVGAFDESLKSVEDRDMWLRLAVHVPCIQVASPCWLYRSHGDQMSRNAERMFDNHDRVLRKFFADRPEYAPLRSLAYSYLYFDAAWSFFAQGDRWRALKYLAMSAFLHPGGLHGSARRLPWARCKELVRYSLGDRLFSLLRPQAR